MINLNHLQHELINLQNDVAYHFAKDLDVHINELVNLYPKLKITIITTASSQGNNKNPLLFHFDFKDMNNESVTLNAKTDINTLKIKLSNETLFNQVMYFYNNFMVENDTNLYVKIAKNFEFKDFMFECSIQNIDETTKAILGKNYSRYEKEMLEQNMLNIDKNKKNKL